MKLMICKGRRIMMIYKWMNEKYIRMLGVWFQRNNKAKDTVKKFSINILKIKNIIK